LDYAKLRQLAYACIDVGSNTTRLLVAEIRGGTLREIESRREFTRLGKALLEGGAIPQEKIALNAGVVAVLANAAREAGAREVTVIATAAVRHARNKDELAAAINERCGLTLRVLSGSEEAKLAFVGATLTGVEPPQGEIAVIDAGGWSTEVVLGSTRNGVRWSESFPVGSGLLADKHLVSNPPSADELATVRARVSQAFDGVSAQGAEQALAVGGSATSLRRLAGGTLTPEALENAIHKVTSMPLAPTADELQLHPERIRLMPAAMLILAELSRRLDLPLKISKGGLREGTILELALRGQTP
jgi:exopolyphosphatase / guanosine-5'-triphosphate,3'-diphosphate pyrophosphatase